MDLLAWMKPQGEPPSPEKQRRGRRWDLAFGLSYPLVFALGALDNVLVAHDGGSALGGRVAASVFQVLGGQGDYRPVPASAWILNLVVTALTFIVGLVAAAGLAYFAVKYLFLPMFRARNRNSLF